MTSLFDPIQLRDLQIRNRAWLSPMCQYSVLAEDGVPTDWHLVHLGSRAVGGFGLIVAEASGVVPEGRISPQDTGIWNDEQAAVWARIAAFCHDQGAAFGIQLAHAGRKASTYRGFPGEPTGSVPVGAGGWQTVGPTSQAFPTYDAPRALTTDEVAAIPATFAAAAVRADLAGLDIVEIHAAHGYLIHQFYSPLSNSRTDRYGGDWMGRTQLLRETVAAVREVWPERKPLFVRISATEWVADGWSDDDSVRLAIELKDAGVDLIDTSTGGNVMTKIPSSPGYQVPFADRIRRETGLPTAAVGQITDPAAAEAIIAEGQADAIMLARVGLREPAWPLRAAAELGAPQPVVPQYHRGIWPQR